MPSSQGWKTRHTCHMGRLKEKGKLRIGVFRFPGKKNLHSVTDRCHLERAIHESQRRRCWLSLKDCGLIILLESWSWLTPSVEPSPSYWFKFIPTKVWKQKPQGMSFVTTTSRHRIQPLPFCSHEEHPRNSHRVGFHVFSANGQQCSHSHTHATREPKLL